MICLACFLGPDHDRRARIESQDRRSLSMRKLSYHISLPIFVLPISNLLMATSLCRSRCCYDSSSYRLKPLTDFFSLVHAKFVRRGPTHAGNVSHASMPSSLVETQISAYQSFYRFRQGPARHMHPHRMLLPSWWTAYCLETENPKDQTDK